MRQQINIYAVICMDDFFLIVHFVFPTLYLHCDICTFHLKNINFHMKNFEEYGYMSLGSIRGWGKGDVFCHGGGVLCFFPPVFFYF